MDSLHLMIYWKYECKLSAFFICINRSFSESVNLTLSRLVM
jgi:hypothetical protein